MGSGGTPRVVVFDEDKPNYSRAGWLVPRKVFLKVLFFDSLPVTENFRWEISCEKISCEKIFRNSG